METNDLDNFGANSESGDTFESGVAYLENVSTRRYRPSPKRLLPPLIPIDFENYVQNKCQKRVTILNRESFHQIEKPIIIFFNHFREKCAYHTKCLDKLYQLALKYHGRIEFIAADMLDVNIMNSKWHPLNLFCRISSPEKVSSLIYAIDEQKRIHEHNSTDKDLDALITLCENLLRNKLFKTQLLAETNNQFLVKICTHHDYKQVVINSSKHILLVVDVEDYAETINDDELNYETLAENLKHLNVDVVYINAAKNYIPFELGISTYPALIFMPHDDKTKYIEAFSGTYTQENIIKNIKSYCEDPNLFLVKKQLELRKNTYQPLEISPDCKLNLSELQQYLQENCQRYLKVFEREAFLRTNRFIIIAFLDFQNNECLGHHLKWIDVIYQVARNLSSPREYFIADFKDIDVINASWEAQDFRKYGQAELITPKVFGIDLNKNKFVLKDFKNAASLFYFAYSLTNGELYISEPWPNMSDEKLVKTCIADSLNLSINSVKKDILLAIYYSSTESDMELLEILEEIARDLEKYPLKVIKIDSRLNCIPVELDNSMYPIMYFIPQSDKSQRIRFPSTSICKEEIVEFVKRNMLDASK